MSEPLRDVRETLVVANHILANERVVDGYGHVGARHPSDPQRFLISRSIASELVTEPVTYLSAGEARSATKTQDATIDRPWDFWRRKAEAGR